MSETKQKLIPTNGKRPEGLDDYDLVWVQFKNGAIDCRSAISCYWEENFNGTGTPISNPVVAYLKAEPPEPYVPEPDYSKCVGCLCWVWDRNEKIALVRPLDSYDPEEEETPFRTDLSRWCKCRPLTPDEVREYLKKAKEAHAK